MKLVYYRHRNMDQYGVLKDETIYPVKGDIFREYETLAEGIGLEDVTLLPPVRPRKLICVGLNYTLHAQESNSEVPEEPMIFMCSPAAIIGPKDTIKLNDETSSIDYEAELAFVIKREAKDVQLTAYQDYILGYTCANDVSNRDLQRKDGQFTRAKSFDTYKPLGPWLETELNPNHLNIKLWQNGELKQSSNTNDMIFPVEKILQFVSGIMMLEPGDVILMGTPSGVGPMREGDTIEIEIEGIGRLKNNVC